MSERFPDRTALESISAWSRSAGAFDRRSDTRSDPGRDTLREAIELSDLLAGWTPPLSRRQLDRMTSERLEFERKIRAFEARRPGAGQP